MRVLASAGGEKVAVMLTMDYLRRDAATALTLTAICRAVPDVAPADSDGLQ